MGETVKRAAVINALGHHSAWAGHLSSFEKQFPDNAANVEVNFVDMHNKLKAQRFPLNEQQINRIDQEDEKLRSQNLVSLQDIENGLKISPTRWNTTKHFIKHTVTREAALGALWGVASKAIAIEPAIGVAAMGVCLAATGYGAWKGHSELSGLNASASAALPRQFPGLKPHHEISLKDADKKLNLSEMQTNHVEKARKDRLNPPKTNIGIKAGAAIQADAVAQGISGYVSIKKMTRWEDIDTALSSSPRYGKELTDFKAKYPDKGAGHNKPVDLNQLEKEIDLSPDALTAINTERNKTSKAEYKRRKENQRWTR